MTNRGIGFGFIVFSTVCFEGRLVTRQEYNQRSTRQQIYHITSLRESVPETCTIGKPHGSTADVSFEFFFLCVLVGALQ